MIDDKPNSPDFIDFIVAYKITDGLGFIAGIIAALYYFTIAIVLFFIAARFLSDGL